METEKKEKKVGKGSTSRKVRNLQKQYNQILVDLFDKYASESIEEALDSSEGSFGENITSIVQNATSVLQCKVLEELGIQGIKEVEIGFEDEGDEEPAGVFSAMFGTNEEEDLDDIEHEAGETDEEETKERKTGEEDEDEKDDEKDEEDNEENDKDDED